MKVKADAAGQHPAPLAPDSIEHEPPEFKEVRTTIRKRLAGGSMKRTKMEKFFGEQYGKNGLEIMAGERELMSVQRKNKMEKFFGEAYGKAGLEINTEAVTAPVKSKSKMEKFFGEMYGKNGLKLTGGITDGSDKPVRELDTESIVTMLSKTKKKNVVYSGSDNDSLRSGSSIPTKSNPNDTSVSSILKQPTRHFNTGPVFDASPDTSPSPSSDQLDMGQQVHSLPNLSVPELHSRNTPYSTNTGKGSKTIADTKQMPEDANSPTDDDSFSISGLLRRKVSGKKEKNNGVNSIDNSSRRASISSDERPDGANSLAGVIDPTLKERRRSSTDGLRGSYPPNTSGGSPNLQGSNSANKASMQAKPALGKSSSSAGYVTRKGTRSGVAGDVAARNRMSGSVDNFNFAPPKPPVSKSTSFLGGMGMASASMPAFEISAPALQAQAKAQAQNQGQGRTSSNNRNGAAPPPPNRRLINSASLAGDVANIRMNGNTAGPLGGSSTNLRSGSDSHPPLMVSASAGTNNRRMGPGSSNHPSNPNPKTSLNRASSSAASMQQGEVQSRRSSSSLRKDLAMNSSNRRPLSQNSVQSMTQQRTGTKPSTSPRPSSTVGPVASPRSTPSNSSFGANSPNTPSRQKQQQGQAPPPQQQSQQQPPKRRGSSGGILQQPGPNAQNHRGMAFQDGLGMSASQPNLRAPNGLGNNPRGMRSSGKQKAPAIPFHKMVPKRASHNRRVKFDEMVCVTDTWRPDQYDRTPPYKEKPESMAQLHVYADVMTFKLTEMLVHESSLQYTNNHLNSCSAPTRAALSQVLQYILTNGGF